MAGTKYVSAFFSSSVDKTDLNCTEYDEELNEICDIVETTESKERNIFDSYFDESLVKLSEEIEKT